MRVHHIGYLVKNIDSAIYAFEDLGYSIKEKKMYDGFRKIYICFMEKDGYVVELISPAGNDSVVAGLIRRYRNAPYHLCYSSERFEEDLVYLSSKGYVKIDEPHAAPALGGDVVFLMSPLIGMIELYENKYVDSLVGDSKEG